MSLAVLWGALLSLSTVAGMGAAISRSVPPWSLQYVHLVHDMSV